MTARFSASSGAHKHDTVLFGIAALGSLFSDDFAAAKENLHATLARRFQARLDADVTDATAPDFELIGALVLKTLYLRSTARPYATWMASCTTMQTISMMGGSIEDLAFDEAPQDSCCEARQVLWIARLLNTWIANEFGRPPITTSFDRWIVPPEPHDPIFAGPEAQMVYLYRVSISLCPENEGLMEVFKDSITKLAVIDPRHCHDVVLLSRAVLAFCCHRLARSNGSTALSPQIFDSLVSIGFDGVHAAKRLAQQQKPWWHLANAPFQFVCAMLTIDSSSSFAQVPAALEAFEVVARAMTSPRITEMLELARRLVRLSRQQKTEQLQHLDLCLISSYEHTSMGQTAAPSAGEGIQMPNAVPELSLSQQPFEFEGIDGLDSLDWSSLSNMGIPLLDQYIQEH